MFIEENVANALKNNDDFKIASISYAKQLGSYLPFCEEKMRSINPTVRTGWLRKKQHPESLTREFVKTEAKNIVTSEIETLLLSIENSNNDNEIIDDIAVIAGQFFTQYDEDAPTIDPSDQGAINYFISNHEKIIYLAEKSVLSIVSNINNIVKNNDFIKYRHIYGNEDPDILSKYIKDAANKYSKIISNIVEDLYFDDKHDLKHLKISIK